MQFYYCYDYDYCWHFIHWFALNFFLLRVLLTLAYPFMTSRNHSFCLSYFICCRCITKTIVSPFLLRMQVIIHLTICGWVADRVTNINTPFNTWEHMHFIAYKIIDSANTHNAKKREEKKKNLFNYIGGDFSFAFIDVVLWILSILVAHVRRSNGSWFCARRP